MKQTDSMVEKVAEMHKKKDLNGLIKASRYHSKPPDGGDIVIRSVAVMGLGEIGGKRAIKALIKALSDDERTVRFSSVRELMKLKVPKIMEILSKTFSEDEYKRCLVFIQTLDKWEA